MTSLLTRSPLQQHMPAMNRGGVGTAGRRRTARHFDEVEGEEGGPVRKKARNGDEEGVGGNGAGVGTGAGDKVGEKGKVNGGKGRRKVYEEADEGFNFSRAKSKRGKSGEAEKKSDPAPVKASKPASPPPKKRPRKTLPVTPEKDDGRPVRRSKRLSGENEARAAGVDDPFVETTTRAGKKAAAKIPAPAQVAQAKQVDDREDSPAVQNGGLNALHVSKKRTPKRIDLIESETPVIRRNKAMRQTTADTGSRRSSAGLRGKRASSLIDAGTSSALPHTEVETGEFYKHISQDLVEPRRMKQLLVWCGSRALGEKRVEGEGAEEGQARHAARTIEEELISAFSTRNDLSNWFDRPDEAAGSVSLIKKPNPRNVQNVAKLAELEAELARLHSEKASWDSLMTSIPAPSPPPTTTPQPLEPHTINASLLSPSQAEILSTLLQPLSSTSQPPSQPNPPAPASTEEQVQSRLSTSAKDLHFKIDLYHDSLHKLEQFVDTAGRVAERVLEKTAERLEEREKEKRERGERENGGVRVGEMDALRALGRVVNKKE
ncbi:Mis12-Mtw1 protein family-domain-containing protein [Elsinoe ampelina]|uniref:Mis12-Mtw1 protein family-domain-containing protein n=1 Tax=Elsinoe ampelina TaxID=302913 RepID=A0A6A6G596_9PEZI|nr:Mis12-Mtw1 protein family-domain-containing protein [Elsinoe ampelina]